MTGFVAGVAISQFNDLAGELKRMSAAMSRGGSRVRQIDAAGPVSCLGMDSSDGCNRIHHSTGAGSTVIFDGFFANLLEIAETLSLDSGSNPADVFQHGIARYGYPWLQHIDGTFAVLVIDAASGEITLARDRFGHRPLYFLLSSDVVWVASEIKALLCAPGYSVALNSDKLHSCISYGFTPGPETLFQNVTKCVPGFAIHVKRDGATRYENFYEPKVESNQKLTFDEGVSTLSQLLANNVRSYQNVCPNAGIMLSGGVDSALLAKLLVEGGEDSPYAISFGDQEWADDESSEARVVAEKLNMRFSVAHLSSADKLLDDLERVVEILEEPTRFENAIALLMMARVARTQCSALMTGEGADYMLGAREHLVISRLMRFLRIPRFMRHAMSALRLQNSSAGRARALGRFLQWHSIRDYFQLNSANCTDLVPGASKSPGNDIVALYHSGQDGYVAPSTIHLYDVARRRSLLGRAHGKAGRSRGCRMPVSLRKQSAL